MKTSLNKFLIILFVMLVILSCSKEEDQVVAPEPATQELLIGTWNVNRAYAGESGTEFIYNSGDVFLTFQNNTTMIVDNNSGSELPYPLNVPNITYELKRLCDEIGNFECDETMKAHYLTFDSFNYQILQPPSENILVFGNDPMHQFTFYLTRVIN